MDEVIEASAIPVELARKTFNHLPYGSNLSVGMKLLYYTGCRISELDAMKPQHIKEGYIWWQIGKNQKGWRREWLPPEFIREIVAYRRQNRTTDARILSPNASTFSRQFRLARNTGELPTEWNEKVPKRFKNGFVVCDFKYMLKGFRKTFATLEFAKRYEEFNDATIALEFTSKRMRHSSTHMTAYHYIQEFNRIKPSEVKALDIKRSLPNVTQMPLQEYF